MTHQKKKAEKREVSRRNGTPETAMKKRSGGEHQGKSQGEISKKKKKTPKKPRGDARGKKRGIVAGKDRTLPTRGASSTRS